MSEEGRCLLPDMLTLSAPSPRPAALAQTCSRKNPGQYAFSMKDRQLF